MTTIQQPTSETYRRQGVGQSYIPDISKILGKVSSFFGKADDPVEILANQEIADIVEKSMAPKAIPNLPVANSESSILYSLGQIPSEMKTKMNDYIKPMNGAVQIIHRGSSRFLDTQISTYEVVFYGEQSKTDFESYISNLAKAYDVQMSQDKDALLQYSYSKAA